MMETIYQPQDSLIDWATERMAESYAGFRSFRTDARAIGQARNGHLSAVVVFDTFADGDCQVHLVSDGSRRWISREFITRVMAYPFRQLKQKRITALVSEFNEESLTFTRRFGGWAEEGRMRCAGPLGEDMLLFGMLAPECPWLKPDMAAMIDKARAHAV